ncbi:hypothetical protein NQ317_012030 [Molorchus minor]|uniref:Uncharacterized protein n=1 Tax=Molorchus minor TaxID=1323400 RepID=A0ABQ9J114_9CUCU|nr:hypothetical protein NQ317_012030 [Molorchus minor]
MSVFYIGECHSGKSNTSGFNPTKRTFEAGINFDSSRTVQEQFQNGLKLVQQNPNRLILTAHTPDSSRTIQNQNRLPKQRHQSQYHLNDKLHIYKFNSLLFHFVNLKIKAYQLKSEERSIRSKPNYGVPVWSQTYTVKGILHIPYAEINEPFYAWLVCMYDAPSKQSRIDYYGDMVKTYQLGGSGYGTSLKLAPVTTETEENIESCLQVNGTNENRIVPQAILPNLEGFECAGEETIDENRLRSGS